MSGYECSIGLVNGLIYKLVRHKLGQCMHCKSWGAEYFTRSCSDILYKMWQMFEMSILQFYCGVSELKRWNQPVLGHVTGMNAVSPFWLTETTGTDFGASIYIVFQITFPGVRLLYNLTTCYFLHACKILFRKSPARPGCLHRCHKWLSSLFHWWRHRHGWQWNCRTTL